MSNTFEFSADKLTVHFENGALRYIRYNNVELIRMIYFVVRDENWGSIFPEITWLEPETNISTFRISFKATCQRDNIIVEWDGLITGDANNLEFMIHGHVLSNFLRNRIGFCVLHPIHNCVGQPVIIHHPQGESETGKFPEHIAPHQPFKDIAGMQWEVEGVESTLRFEGDIFECEDQRNWLDASYKTYCTPLEVPFPVQVNPGDEIRQHISMHIRENKPGIKSQASPTLQLKLLPNYRTPVPAIGLESNEATLSVQDKSLLQQLPCNHLRVEARMHEVSWQEGFQKRLDQVKALDLPVSLVLFMEKNSKQALNNLVYINGQINKLQEIILIDVNRSTVQPEYLDDVLTMVQNAFPGIPVGGGTDMYFTELNRSRPPAGRLDFLTFSVNPQVHAIDDLSLIENLETIPHVIESAHIISQHKPLHVSPVTLRPRFNPVATSNDDDAQLMKVDHRQNTLFNAVWSLGSFKHFAQSGVKKITYFQTVGAEGIMDKGSKFPVFEAFQALLHYKGGQIIHTQSSHPLRFDGMILEKNGKSMLFLMNYSDRDIKIETPVGKVELKPYGWYAQDAV